MKTCDICNASSLIKNSLGCKIDRTFNNFEVLKNEFCKTFNLCYKPKFRCRFIDLVKDDNQWI